MPEMIARCTAGGWRWGTSGALSGLPHMLLLIVAAFCNGCGGGGDAVAITGEVMLDGIHMPAEIQIEQLDVEGNRVGRSVAAYADESGLFSASIERSQSRSEPLACSFVVRVSQLSSSGLPTAFDENAPREKVVRLRRTVSNHQSLSFLLTR